jgi:hypothetical protein
MASVSVLGFPDFAQVAPGINILAGTAERFGAIYIRTVMVNPASFPECLFG